MNLLELQRRMSEDVRRPLTDDFEMQATTEDGRSTAELAESYVRPNALLTSFERLEIYNRQYWFRVIAAVSEDFPALSAVMGRKRFDELVLAYLKDTPSTSFTLRDLGGHLSDWLEAHREFGLRRHDLMVDVARLEWAYIESFDGGAVVPISQESLAALNGSSKLWLQPHLQLLDLRYPVDELVLAVHRDKPESGIASNAVTEHKSSSRDRLPSVRRAATYLAVHRFNDSVYYRRIDRENLMLLRSLKEGHCLSDALANAFKDSVLPAELQTLRIQEYFSHAAELGWFCAEKLDLIFDGSMSE